MFKRSMSRLFGFALLAVSAILLSHAPARAQAAVTCEVDGEATPRRVLCPLRVDTPSQVTSAQVLVSNTGAAVPSEIVDIPVSDEPSSWLFLVDVSNPRRAAAVRAAGDLFKSVIRSADANERYALATLASDYSLLAPFGSTPEQLNQAADAMQAQGLATELYRNALQGIQALEREDAANKALVLISDGKAEDTATTAAQVVEAANNAGVIIYGVGMPERANDTPSLQSLRQLADGTGGVFTSADPRTKAVPSSFVNDFRQPVLGGGRFVAFEAPDPGTAYTIDLAVEGGTRLRLNATQLAENDSDPGTSRSRNTTGPVVAQDGTTFGFLNDLQDQFFFYWNDPVWRWVIIGAGVVLGLLLLLLLFGGGRNKRDDGFNAPTSNFDTAPGASGTDHATTAVPAAAAAAVPGGGNRFFTRPRADGGGVFPGEENTARISANGAEEATHMVVSASRAVFKIDDAGQNRRYEMKSPSVRIGRHSDNDLMLEDDSVHRSHAILHSTPDGALVITDLNTTNGIVVNGALTDKADLAVGDVVELGEAKLTVASIS